MQTDILAIVERFASDANLSDHRAGIVLAKNGRLLERLRKPKRGIWPETAETILAAVERERKARGLDVSHTPAHGPATPSLQGRKAG